MHVIRRAEANEVRAALSALLARPGSSPQELHRQIDTLMRYASKSSLSLEHCLVAESSSKLLTACLCIDSPGRTANVFLPNDFPSEACADLVVAMLREHATQAAGRNVQLLQALVAPEAASERALLERAGFTRLTELIYLERNVARAAPPELTGPPAIWEEYNRGNHEDFAKVIHGTYEGSLDCAALSGVRDIEDTLMSHRATGDFDPRCWLLARSGAELVGVLLLARIPERGSTEVVYMGLLPYARGKRYGLTLLRRALEVARAHGTAALTLTVDVENRPARRLYTQFGFIESTRREVWMRVLPASS